MIEDACHYFFICPNYNDQRLVLLYSVSQITEPRLSYLLRGNYQRSVNDNNKLFNYVQTFIQETTRFNRIYLCVTFVVYIHSRPYGDVGASFSVTLRSVTCALS